MLRHVACHCITQYTTATLTNTSTFFEGSKHSKFQGHEVSVATTHELHTASMLVLFLMWDLKLSKLRGLLTPRHQNRSTFGAVIRHEAYLAGVFNSSGF
jgi:hypothetical protein